MASINESPLKSMEHTANNLHLLQGYDLLTKLFQLQHEVHNFENQNRFHLNQYQGILQHVHQKLGDAKLQYISRYHANRHHLTTKDRTDALNMIEEFLLSTKHLPTRTELIRMRQDFLIGAQNATYNPPLQGNVAIAQPSGPLAPNALPPYISTPLTTGYQTHQSPQPSLYPSLVASQPSKAPSFSQTQNLKIVRNTVIEKGIPTYYEWHITSDGKSSLKQKTKQGMPGWQDSMLHYLKNH